MMVGRKLFLHFKVLEKAMSNNQLHLKKSNSMIDDSCDKWDSNYMPYFLMEQIPK